MLKQYRVHLFFTMIGIVLGYIFLHPYAMFIYALVHRPPGGVLHLSWHQLGVDTVFRPMMLPMAISFAAIGGLIGLLIGIVVDRKKKLYSVELENEKKKTALETLTELMVTLSHYLLNANMIIGGQVRQCQKAASNQDILAALRIIEEQGRKIDAVLTSLRKITEIKTANYTSDGQVMMIDITREIEDQLKEIKTGTYGPS